MPRRRVPTTRVQYKLLKALQAKTIAGKANYLTDAIAEEWLGNYDLDTLLHAVIDLGLTEGTDAERIDRWIRKSIRYGIFSS